jgi:HEPN domain-containing protein
MSRRRFPPDDPREWLNRAKSHLALPRNLIPGVDLEDLCFEAQQAAEMAVKAVFIKRSEKFPFSHDLDKLLRLLEKNAVKIPHYLNAAEELTQYAHVTRYPGLEYAITRRDHRRAVRIATAALVWAERQVEPGAKRPKGKK